MNYIKQHWFGISVSVFMAYFLLVFIMVAISPRTDIQNRGFIPCSHEQTEKIINCTKNKALCVIHSAVRGNFCYMKVFNLGLWKFLSGKQSRPWSNYLFAQETQQNNEKYQEEINKLLEEDPNLIDGIEDLKEKNRELLKKINKNQEDNVHHDKE